ncbi:MAG: benzoate/H(+) symporter BenE family transporter [Synergistetes bacterium]|nr:benzoate/H(+) symporter BenE family transporter [Synergistota bacterium]MCX8127133.1 benzoate/H(+) symporter BenE family transporter [Synergistota bacterium]MDW8191980.1 benzoate/H(+) symporter BenE family transporter [Synergistota bacterium]
MSKTNFTIWEKGPGFASGIRDLGSKINANTITAGVVAAIFGCTGPALIIMNAAQNGKLTDVQTISWLFSVYFLGGLISLVLALYYKMPVNGAWSIPGAVMMASALPLFPFNQVVGSYLIAGIIVLFLGVSGLIGRAMRWIPLPIVMAMIAGAMFRFGLGIVTSTQKAPLIGTAVLVSYFVGYRLSRKISPILWALIVGIIVAFLSGGVKLAGVKISWMGPQFFTPSFSTEALFAIAIPLAILVIGAENAQAYGVLTAEGYKAPINAMTVISGIGGIITSIFGGHNANIAGPMTAICSSDTAGPDKSGRYAATVVNGILFGSFGLFASIVVPFVRALPAELISLLAGLSMIGVLLNAFEGAFSPKKFRYGAFFALVIAMSGIVFLKISSPFWALVGGVIASMILEPQDFKS